MKDRREFLKTLAAVGACAMTPAGGLLAQQAAYKPTARGGCIDVHHHLSPPRFGGGGGRGGGGAGRGGGGGLAAWTPQQSIEQMDKFGIGVAILSLTQSGDIIYDNTEKARTAVRTVNDFGAKCMQDYPKRFGFFASIPFPDVEGSLKEITYAYDTLKCDGIGIYTNDQQGQARRSAPGTHLGRTRPAQSHPVHASLGTIVLQQSQLRRLILHECDRLRNDARG